jgi:lipocalin
VLALGPVIDDQYQYAVVSDPNQFSLYVLARNPQLFAAKWDADVRAQLNAWGFNQFWNEPKPMIQDGCPPF